jgi:hypothetical protein
MKLVKYRDAGMSTYTYFWTDSGSRVISPYFDSEEDAKAWTEDKLVSLDDAEKFAEKRNYTYGETK